MKIKYAITATALIAATAATTVTANKAQSANCPQTITGSWEGSLGTPENPQPPTLSMDISKPSWTNELTAEVTAPVTQTVTAIVQCDSWVGDGFTGQINETQDQIIGLSSGQPYFLNRVETPSARVSAGDAEITEPDPGGAVTLNFTVSLTAPIISDATVTYQLSGITTESQDVRDTGFDQPKNISFNAGGALQKTVGIRVWGDSQIEPDEEIQLTILSTTVPGGILDNIAIGTVVNNDI